MNAIRELAVGGHQRKRYFCYRTSTGLLAEAKHPTRLLPVEPFSESGIENLSFPMKPASKYLELAGHQNGLTPSIVF